MLVGPNGRPIVKSEGPTGRRLIVHEIMVKGQPELKLEAHGAWSKPCNNPQDQAREEIYARLLMSTYFQRMSVAVLGAILMEFKASEVEQEVQGHINNIAQAAKEQK